MLVRKKQKLSENNKKSLSIRREGFFITFGDHPAHYMLFRMSER